MVGEVTHRGVRRGLMKRQAWATPPYSDQRATAWRVGRDGEVPMPVQQVSTATVRPMAELKRERAPILGNSSLIGDAMRSKNAYGGRRAMLSAAIAARRLRAAADQTAAALKDLALVNVRELLPGWSR